MKLEKNMLHEYIPFLSESRQTPLNYICCFSFQKGADYKSLGSSKYQGLSQYLLDSKF